MKSDSDTARHRTIYSLCAAVLVAGIASAGALDPPLVPQQTSGVVSDTPELARLFPKQEQQADYVVVLDRSLSMKKYWTATEQALNTFLRAIPPGDHVSFVTFDKNATNTQLLPRVIAEAGRAKLLEELTALGPPRVQAGSDSWNFTDLGSALEAVLTEMNRPNASRLQFVFLLTDFVHEPASGSRFRSASPAEAEWQSLASRGKVVRTGRALQTFAIVLPVDGRAERDIGLVETVMGPVLRVRSDAQTLQQWFERRAVEVERSKYALLATADIAKGWTWETMPDGSQTKLVLRSALDRLTLSVVLRDVALNGQPASLKSETPQQVAAKASAAFVLDVEPCSVAEPSVSDWVRWLVSRGGYETTQLSIRSAGTIEILPGGDLVKAGVPASYPVALPGSGMGVLRRCGAPWWLQGALTLFLLGSIAFSWRTWLKPAARLQASFRRVVVSGPGVSETLDFPKTGCTSLRFGSTPAADVRCALPSPLFEVVFTSVKPAFPRTAPVRGVYVHRTGGDVFYRGREFDSRSRKWVERDLPVPTRPGAAIRVTSQTRLKIQRDGQTLTIALRF